MPTKTVKTSHVRELTDLELQVVDMALDDSDADLVFALGTETVGGKTIPFVSIQRKGSDHEITVRFRDKDKTAEHRRNTESGIKIDGRSISSKKPALKPKPTAAKK
jgi:hypothetical protein